MARSLAFGLGGPREPAPIAFADEFIASAAFALAFVFDKDSRADRVVIQGLRIGGSFDGEVVLWLDASTWLMQLLDDMAPVSKTSRRHPESPPTGPALVRQPDLAAREIDALIDKSEPTEMRARLAEITSLFASIASSRRCAVSGLPFILDLMETMVGLRLSDPRKS